MNEQTETENKKGVIEVLNAGRGHLELRFDKSDPIELARAKRAIEEMLKRGFALFAHDANDKLARVLEFDENKSVYIIADVPGAFEDVPAETRRGRPVKEVPAEATKVTAVGRSAGG